MPVSEFHLIDGDGEALCDENGDLGPLSARPILTWHAIPIDRRCRPCGTTIDGLGDQLTVDIAIHTT